MRGLYNVHIPPLGTNDGMIDDVFIKCYTILWQLVRSLDVFFKFEEVSKSLGHSIALLVTPTSSKLLAISQAQSSLRASASPSPWSPHKLRQRWLLLRRPFLKTLSNIAPPQNLDTEPCFVCFEAVVTIKSYLFKKRIYCLFLWLKYKPHEIRNYSSALFASNME